jgi:hypothetical protein
MKLIHLTTLLFSASIFFYSCGQNTDKEKLKSTKEKSTTKPNYIIDTLEIEKMYFVKTDKSYFFEQPDSLLITKEFLPEGELIRVSALSNGFGYATYSSTNDSSLAGWVLLSTLDNVKFTPPKLEKNDKNE